MSKAGNVIINIVPKKKFNNDTGISIAIIVKYQRREVPGNRNTLVIIYFWGENIA